MQENMPIALNRKEAIVLLVVCLLFGAATLGAVYQASRQKPEESPRVVMNPLQMKVETELRLQQIRADIHLHRQEIQQKGWMGFMGENAQMFSIPRPTSISDSTFLVAKGADAYSTAGSRVSWYNAVHLFSTDPNDPYRGKVLIYRPDTDFLGFVPGSEMVAAHPNEQDPGREVFFKGDAQFSSAFVRPIADLQAAGRVLHQEHEAKLAQQHAKELAQRPTIP